jgi:hypothetical protein
MFSGLMCIDGAEVSIAFIKLVKGKDYETVGVGKKALRTWLNLRIP